MYWFRWIEIRYCQQNIQQTCRKQLNRIKKENKVISNMIAYFNQVMYINQHKKLQNLRLLLVNDYQKNHNPSSFHLIFFLVLALVSLYYLLITQIVIILAGYQIIFGYIHPNIDLLSITIIILFGASMYQYFMASTKTALDRLLNLHFKNNQNQQLSQMHGSRINIIDYFYQIIKFYNLCSLMYLYNQFMLIWLISIIITSIQTAFLPAISPTNFIINKISAVPISNNNNQTFSLALSNYDTSKFTSTFKAYATIYNLQWDAEINIEILSVTVSESSIKIKIISNGLNNIGFNVLLYDRSHYEINTNIFTFQTTPPSSEFISRTVNITNHKKYDLGFMQAINAISNTNNYVLTYTKDVVTAPNSYNFTFTYDQSILKLTKVKYILMTIAKTHQSPLNTEACTQVSTVNNVRDVLTQSLYLPLSNTDLTYIFYGLHTIQKFSLNNGKINIRSITTQNSKYLFSVYSLVSLCCLAITPYYSTVLSTCVVACEPNQFVDVYKYCYTCSQYCLQCINSITCVRCQTSFFIKTLAGQTTCKCPNQVITYNGRNVCIAKKTIQVCPIINNVQTVQQGNRCV